MRNKYVSNIKRSVLKRFGAIAMVASVTATMGCFNLDVFRADMTDTAEAEASVYADVSESNDNTVTVVDSGSCGDNATYTLDSNGLLTISGSGEIKVGVFRYNPIVKNAAKQVVINEGITSIGNWAFGECVLIESITLPSSVTSLGEYAFSSCLSLVNINIPDGVTNIQ